MEDGYEDLTIEASPTPNTAEQNSPLPQEALMQLTTNLGNDETKLITIIAMEPGVYYGQRGLAKRVENFLCRNPSPYVGKSNYTTYCEKSFLQADLVNVREGEKDGKTFPEYGVTHYGARVGTALAGHLLEFSERHPEVSLQKLLGSTKSSSIDDETGAKITSPELRFKIYYELLTAKLPVRLADLARELSEKPTVLKRHLDELDLGGVLSFKSANSLGPIIEYRINKDKPLPDDLPEGTQYPVLTKEVYSLVKGLTEDEEERWSTIDEVTEGTPMRTTGSFKGSAGLDTTRPVVLRRLANEGYLIRKEFDGILKSTISMTPEQRQTILEFITIIDNFKIQKPEYIVAGVQKAQAILADPSRVHALMTKAKENSPSAAQVPIQEMMQMVLGAIPDDGELEAKDLLQPIEEMFGKKIGRVHLNEVMRKLTDEGKIAVREASNRKYWSLKAL